MRMKLRIFRIKHNLTQEGMAKRLCFSRNQYARVENGEQEPSIRFLVNLSEAFGISLDEAKELTKRDGE